MLCYLVALTIDVKGTSAIGPRARGVLNFVSSVVQT